ncbi:MAG TPA: cysteine--tRNA ligase [Candidatus Nanoarchaeia archaeon]|nr:cysteine--tRNA ligase [Candidatus Nanoarchaeia archaeon]
MKVYNTLTRKKEAFKPINPGRVGWYNCGPTVYNYIHIGNARNVVCFDIIRRYFEYRGYEVKFAQNYTDIDDKMINRAKELGISVSELAQRFIRQYELDAKKLNVKQPTISPKATEHIKQIIMQIKKIQENGYAYETEDGVYFDVSKLKGYGKLSRQNLEELKEGVRHELSEKKKDALDFALWKKEKPGEPSWDSPWSKGRPGWHIECSAMNTTYLGDEFDIHSGGKDLIFPHHENEIAQASASGKKYVRYWLHNAFLNINKEKMSKSLGNFMTADEALKRFDPRAIRYFFLETHYRSEIDFSEENIINAKHSLERIDNFMFANKDAGPNPRVKKIAEKYKKEFTKAMDDDFETPKAIAAVFEMIKGVNKIGTGREAYDFLVEIDSVLGILKKEEGKINEDIESLIQKREDARKKKDFKTADKIRDELKSKGIILEDTDKGVRWKRG